MEAEKTITAKQLIRRLQKMVKIHGDLEVHYLDTETGDIKDLLIHTVGCAHDSDEKVQSLFLCDRETALAFAE